MNKLFLRRSVFVKRCAADFIALLGMLAEAFPRAPVIVVICDNDSIHHARAVTSYLQEHPRLEVLYGARYSPHDNPAERIWAALKNYVANTAVSWPGRVRQIHSFFRARSPDQMLATAAPWTSPWLPPGYEQNFWNAALGIEVKGVRVSAAGGFDTDTGKSTGIGYWLTSVPMSLPIRLHTCLRSLTRSPRFHVLPEPEPPSGGRPESSPAVRERRLPSRARSGMTVRWPDVRLHARAGSEGPRLLSAASTCRLSPVSRPRTRARARNPRPQRTAGQPAPRIPLPPGGSPADHALAGGRAVTRAPVGHPRLLHMASTRPGGSTASLSCASG